MQQDAQNYRTLDVIVLAGGRSSERDVSLNSGRCVADSLHRRGHAVRVIDPAFVSLTSGLLRSCDIVLPMVHGTGGEDGELQQHLESLKIPFCGSSAAASALTFDKVATRSRLQQYDLPVAAGTAFGRIDVIADPNAVQDAADALGYPLVVKPAAQGSSIGVSVVRSRDDLDAAVQAAFQWGSVILLEQYIPGREVTVPIVDGAVFPAVEIIPAGGWYDYHAKYQDEQTQYRIQPAGLPAGVLDASLRACEVCGVTGISRVDLRVNPSGEFFILEINTIPGMTSHSLVPMSAAACGLDPGELWEGSLHRALSRLRLSSSPDAKSNTAA